MVTAGLVLAGGRTHLLQCEGIVVTLGLTRGQLDKRGSDKLVVVQREECYYIISYYNDSSVNTKVCQVDKIDRIIYVYCW